MNTPFRVVDLSAAGETLCSELYTYSALEHIDGAAELIGLFTGLLWREPDEFQTRLLESDLTLRWRPTSPSTGIATLRQGPTLLALSLILCGQNPDADAMHLEVLQKHLLAELHDTGIEPAFDLMNQFDRPIVISLCLRPPRNPDRRRIFSIFDRCLAAAFIRKQSQD
jgi:hypothetical protein